MFQETKEKILTIIEVILVVCLVCYVFHVFSINAERDVHKYDVECLESVIVDQHIKLISPDVETLAKDMVYLDTEKDTDYVRHIIGRGETLNDDKSVSTTGKGEIWSGPEGKKLKYTNVQFKELVEVFESDDNKKQIAVSMVEEYLKNNYDSDLLKMELGDYLIKSVEREKDYPKPPTVIVES